MDVTHCSFCFQQRHFYLSHDPCFIPGMDNAARKLGCFFLERSKVTLCAIRTVKFLCRTKRTQQHVLKDVHAKIAVLVEVNRTKAQQSA